MNILKGYYYTKNHEWVKVDGDEAHIGITDYAQKAMGAIVYVELPEVNDEFEQGETFSTIESVKAASDIYIPIGGTVIEVNEILEDKPELINDDSYENWIVRIKITDKDQLEELMAADEYKAFCESEE